MAGRAMTKIWPKWLDRVNHRGEAEVIDAVQPRGPYFSHSHNKHYLTRKAYFHRNFVVLVISKHRSVRIADDTDPDTQTR